MYAKLTGYMATEACGISLFLQLHATEFEQFQAWDSIEMSRRILCFNCRPHGVGCGRDILMFQTVQTQNLCHGNRPQNSRGGFPRDILCLGTKTRRQNPKEEISVCPWDIESQQRSHYIFISTS